MKKGNFLRMIGFVLLIVVLAGCQKSDDSEKKASSKTVDQLAEPEEGETIATLKVKDYGEIKVHFFEDAAPKAVENFVTHAKEGYYDGLTFHRVINDFMIQSGDPTGTGSGGESIWGEDFEDEISPYLIPLKGALCMANAGGGNTNGSQFFIVQSCDKVDGDVASQLQGALSENNKKNGTDYDSFDQIAADNFSKVGGCLWLSGGYTVFGQVYEGQDIINQIAGVPTDDNDKPKTDVIVESVEISTYEGE